MAGAPAKTVGQEFFAHRLLHPRDFPDRSKLPWPLNMKKYVSDNPRCQTNLCTINARKWFNNMIKETNPQSPKLKCCTGIRSNMFILSDDDPLSYFHLYFKGIIGSKKCHFFAELCGQDGPTTVISCKQVDKTTVYLPNCEYCSGGLRHPPHGPFVGYKPVQPQL